MIDTRLSTAGHPTAFEAEKPFSVFQRIAKKRLFGWLDRLSDGTIQFADSQDSRLFGDADSDAIQAHWNVEDGGFYSHVFRSGSLGMAESYLRGDWHSDNLTNLLAVLYRHQRQDREGRSFTTAFSQLFGRIVQQLNGNTLRGSRRHIAAHYDLSNEFFELFLDPTMMYSAAFFEHDDFSLHEASIAKLNQLCKKLDLQPNDRVLETGTGWGGFAIHAVQEFGIDLTTTTISAAQFKRARQRIADADIENKVRLLDTDYRKLTGQYDKIVSIEMVEAVGERYLDTYFRQCGKLLKPGGRFVLQAIVMPEERYDSYRRGVDFIQSCYRLDRVVSLALVIADSSAQCVGSHRLLEPGTDHRHLAT